VRSKGLPRHVASKRGHEQKKWRARDRRLLSIRTAPALKSIGSAARQEAAFTGPTRISFRCERHLQARPLHQTNQPPPPLPPIAVPHPHRKKMSQNAQTQQSGDARGAESAFSGMGLPLDHSNKPVTYLCGDCNTKVTLKKGDIVRCLNCGYRVLYKERTSRYVSFGGAGRRVERMSCISADSILQDGAVRGALMGRALLSRAIRCLRF
jgi:DNA-directed RNA polymerases I, II, and III subunit RPABC4